MQGYVKGKGGYVMNEQRQTIVGMLGEIISTMCDKYCKFPQMYTGENEDELYEEHCDGCILNKLI